MHVAGIDVGSKTLHQVIRKAGKALKVCEYTNNAEGFRKLISQLRKQKVCRVVIEATGVYHLDLALAIDAAKDIELMVLNPKAAKHYAEARMVRSKTDPVDAAMLAEFAETMPFQSWQAPRSEILVLRTCSRRLAALTKQLTQAKNQLHALSQTCTTPVFIIQDMKLTITQLSEQIASLQRNTMELIAQDAVVQSIFELLVSIKGVAEKSAIQLIGELLVLPEDMRAKQWVAMAGLDPRHHQSGTSVNKKTRISKVGNRYLRMALYMPALCASRHVPEVKAYYQHLINDQGLKKIQAVCAVMRKLLHAIHGMLKSQMPFDSTRFYDVSQST